MLSWRVVVSCVSAANFLPGIQWNSLNSAVFRAIVQFCISVIFVSHFFKLNINPCIFTDEPRQTLNFILYHKFITSSFEIKRFFDNCKHSKMPRNWQKWRLGGSHRPASAIYSNLACFIVSKRCVDVTLPAFDPPCCYVFTFCEISTLMMEPLLICAGLALPLSN